MHRSNNNGISTSDMQLKRTASSSVCIPAVQCHHRTSQSRNSHMVPIIQRRLTGGNAIRNEFILKPTDPNAILGRRCRCARLCSHACRYLVYHDMSYLSYIFAIYPRFSQKAAWVKVKGRRLRRQTHCELFGQTVKFVWRVAISDIFSQI